MRAGLRNRNTIRQSCKLCSQVRLLSNQRHNNDNEKLDKNKELDNANDGNAMARRLEQLLEQANPTPLDPNAGKPLYVLPSDREYLDHKFSQKLQDSKFKNEYRQVYNTLKVPDSADKLSRDIASSEPW